MAPFARARFGQWELPPSASRRKRKKKRKKKLPRASSHSFCGCACRRQRQWRVRRAGVAGSNAPRDVFPVAGNWLLLLGNTAGKDQKDSIFIVVMAVAYARLVLLVFARPAVFPSVCRRAQDAPHHGRSQTRGTVMQWAGFCWLRCTSRFVSFPVVMPLCLSAGPQACLVIMAGMDQKEGYVVPCRKLRKIRSCSSIKKVVDIAFVSPWSRLLRRPQRFPSCVWTGRSMLLLCRSCSSGLLQKPLVFGSYFTVFGVRLWSTGLWIFWETSSECFPYSTLLGLTVDTCLASVYEVFWKNFTRGPSYFSAMLGSAADSCLCVRLRRLVLLLTLHLALCSLPRGQAHRAWHHGQYAH